MSSIAMLAGFMPPRVSGVPQERSTRRFWIVLFLSLLVHTALMVLIKQDPTMPRAPAGGGPLTVELAPRAKPATAPDPTPPKPVVPSKASPPRRASVAPPSLMTSPSKNPQAIQIPIDPPPERPKDRSKEPPSMMDFINARRAQRDSVESAIAQENAAYRARETQSGTVAGGNGSLDRLNLNANTGNTGGVFEILHKGHRTAQFSFNGWNPSLTRNRWKDIIEVDAGVGGNVELAIVRRMIELIRSHYKGDFQWDSHRVGHVVTLSARVEDTEGLERFMVAEFFSGDDRRAESPQPRGRR